jgi:hypothetical protein
MDTKINEYLIYIIDLFNKWYWVGSVRNMDWIFKYNSGECSL